MNAFRPIDNALPGIAAHLPCAGFARLPTPLQRVEIDGRAVWIKRDDLSHPDYGGNKVRKLEFILAAAQRAGQRRVVTFGATGTHHGLATALFCSALGLECEVLLFDQPDSAHVRENRARLQASGAICTPCGSLARTVARFYLHPRRLRRDTLFLFAGGSGELGTLAFVNAALELAEQVDVGEAPRPARIYCATSSGSTLAGLTLGVALAGWDTQVIGVQVADARLGPFDACTPKTIQALMRRSLRWLERRELHWPADWPEVLLDDRWLGPGYGHPTVAAEQAATAFEQAVGVALDLTYTAKAFAALRADTAPGEVLYWHTLSST